MTQELLAPLRRAAFNLQHLAELESFQTWVSQVKRNRNGGDACWGEPLVAKVAGRSKGEATRREFVVKLIHAAFELAAFDADAEIADAPGEKLVVLEAFPGWVGCGLHGIYR